jgi:hypothetical protein
MVGPCETLGGPWLPLAMRPWRVDENGKDLHACVDELIGAAVEPVVILAVVDAVLRRVFTLSLWPGEVRLIVGHFLKNGIRVRNFPSQTLKISKVSLVVMGS